MNPFLPYVNRALFSQHFLDKRLPELPVWAEARPAASIALANVRALYAREKKKLAKYNEEQLRHHWLDPVLVELGAVWDPEPGMLTDAGTSVSPDYLMFADESARTEAQRLLHEGSRAKYISRASFIGDAKRWGTSFTTAAGGQRTPRQQLNDYIHLSGLDWGFLSDGRKFRLTHKSVAGRLDRFYEVDLVQCLESPDDEHFLWFALFFGPAAYRPGPDGRCLLDVVLSGSIAYAREVGEGLKDSVYEVLEIVARGFIRKGSTLPLPELRGECLTLLYRLLFLFYAEDRDLLPVGEESYLPYSLRSLSTEATARLDEGRTFSRNGSLLWGRLKSLFEIVDRGDDDLGIPPYNGGLFDPLKHPLLDLQGPGDDAIAQAVDKLSRTRAVPRERIDYRDLDIRHLGTIYEGLLEYELFVAPGEMRIKEERDGVKKAIPATLEEAAALPESERIHAGEVYSAKENNERHSTGSFYTPDYIVEHVVQDALGPLVAGRTPEELLRLRVVDPAMGSGHFLLAAVDFLARAYGQARIDAGLDDDGVTSDEELSEWRRLVVEHCIYGVDMNPMAVELARLALWLATMARDRPLTFLNLHLKCGNSLVGIPVERTGALAPARKAGANRRGQSDQKDLPLFAEKFRARLPHMINDVLAILERETKTKADVEVKETWEKAIEYLRAPFIDVADVQALLLIADRLADVDAAVESVRPGSAELKAAIAGLRAAAAKEADPKKRKKQLKEADTREAEDAAQNLRLEFDRLVALIEKAKELFDHPLVALSRKERARARWFHWQLLFPEVFFDRLGRVRDDAGFDAVIGNPPWIRQETLKDDKFALEALYPEVSHGAADIYVYFVAAGLGMLAKNGRLALVLPNKWLKADYAAGMRALLTERFRPTSLVDFGHAPVFPDADTFPCLLTAVHRDGSDGDLQFAPITRADLETIEKGSHLTALVREKRYPVRPSLLQRGGWFPLPSTEADLWEKLRRTGRTILQIDPTGASYGIKTGFNEAFLISQEVRDDIVARDATSGSVIRRYMRGEDIDRWDSRWGGQWMIGLVSGASFRWPWSGLSADRAEEVFALEFEAIAEHMKKHRAKLKKRSDQGEYWWELRSCDYWDAFGRPKIAYQQIQFHSSFSYDDKGFFLNDKGFFLPATDIGSASALNSRLMWWFLWRTAPHMKDEALALHKFVVDELPIVSAAETQAERLVGLTARRRAAAREFLDWLRLTIGLPKSTQKLESFWRLTDKGLAAELKRAGLKLSPAGLAEVRGEFEKARANVMALWTEIRTLERETQRLVYDAYGLTSEEVALVERTLPPRDPMQVLDQEFVPFED